MATMIMMSKTTKRTTLKKQMTTMMIDDDIKYMFTGALMKTSFSDLLPRSPEDNCIHKPNNFCFLSGRMSAVR